MSGLKGKKNVYTCEACKATIITVDRDDGVTPFTTSCKRGACRGTMYSSLYRVDQGLVPTHEWYRSTPHEIATKRNPAACLEHHKSGGLFLRETVAHDPH